MATSQQSAAQNAPKNFATYDLDIAEYLEHLDRRHCDNRVIVQKPINMVGVDSNHIQAQAAVGEQLYVINGNAQKNVITVGRPATNSKFWARGSDIQAHAIPHVLSLRGILSANRVLVEATAKKDKLRNKTKSKRETGDLIFKLDAVRTVFRDTMVRKIDGTLATIPASSHIDISTTEAVGDSFRAVRFGVEELHYAVVAEAELDDFSSKATRSQPDETAVQNPDPLMLDDNEDPRYFLVVQDIDTLGQQAKKLPLTRGQVVVMRCSKSEKVGWFRDLHGRPFVLNLKRASKVMEEIDAEALAIERKSYSGNLDPSKLTAHTLHSDRVTPGLPPLQFEDQSMEKAIEEAGMLIYPTSWYGLPLPPSHWVPKGGPGLIDEDYQCWAFTCDEDYQMGRLVPVGVVDILDQNFGCWTFEQQIDYCLALQQGFESAQDVILAALNGKSGLQNIMIGWKSGKWDPTRAPFASAYFHILEIEHRRNLWFGRNTRVAPTEVPVYTGTDPFAHERRGAQNAVLDSMKTWPSKDGRATPTEQSISQQVLDRQGYLARSYNFSKTSLLPNTTNRALQMQEVVLRASDRNAGLWHPLQVQRPINPAAPKHLQTSYHPEYVDMEREELMHDSNYLLHRHQDIKQEIYTTGSNSLAILALRLPLLSASGESLTTLVQTAKSAVQEVTLEDYPFLPQHIAVDEDHALLYTFAQFCPDNKQIAARMDEETRPYWANINNELCYIRWEDRLIAQNQAAATFNGIKAFDKRARDRPVGQAHFANNTLRGIASGKIDPALPKDAVVVDVAGNVGLNWIDFPSTNSHPTQKIESYNRNFRKAALMAREDIIKQQSQ